MLVPGSVCVWVWVYGCAALYYPRLFIELAVSLYFMKAFLWRLVNIIFNFMRGACCVNGRDKALPPTRTPTPQHQTVWGWTDRLTDSHLGSVFYAGHKNMYKAPSTIKYNKNIFLLLMRQYCASAQCSTLTHTHRHTHTNIYKAAHTHTQTHIKDDACICCFLFLARCNKT